MSETTIQRVEAGNHLSMPEMAETIGWIMDGLAGPSQIARLLTALHRKGETVDEVAGAAVAMRARMTRIRCDRGTVIDTCGTGGDGSRTFNISTAAALVAAAAGATVAKHGNRAATSRSGSADVLTALGVNVQAAVPCVEACLEELGICFCFAPLLHEAMRFVAPVRRALTTPTIFNVLGPLVNPAGAPFQLLGVGRRPLAGLLGQALARLGAQRVLIVHGSDGLDEVTLAGTTWVVEFAAGECREYPWSPADFDLSPSPREPLLVDGPEQSAEMIRGVLDGRAGPARDIVLANAAAALWTVGRANSLRDGVRLAAEAIDSGAAKGLLARLAERTNR